MRHHCSMTAQPLPARRRWDLALTIVLLVLHIGFVLVACIAGFLLAVASDSCGASSACNYDQIATGMMVGVGGPAVVGLLTVGVAIIFLVRRRLAFWIPIVGSVLALVVEVVAWMLASGAVVPNS
ncbi:MAG: DUF6264 family protein [Rhodoglobus sp.]